MIWSSIAAAAYPNWYRFVSTDDAGTGPLSVTSGSLSIPSTATSSGTRSPIRPNAAISSTATSSPSASTPIGFGSRAIAAGSQPSISSVTAPA